MNVRSHQVARMGVEVCELCGGRGEQNNPLTLHHVDGNPKNNDPANKMVAHRVLCHTFADFITQLKAKYGRAASRGDILRAWQEIIYHTDLIFSRRRPR